MPASEPLRSEVLTTWRTSNESEGRQHFHLDAAAFGRDVRSFVLRDLHGNFASGRSFINADGRKWPEVGG